MNTSKRRAYTALGVVLASIASVAIAATFNLFSPASGILVGNPSTYVTTAATSTNVVSLWSGSCSSSTFLRGDGSCAAAGTGSVTSVGLSAPSVFSVSGSPVTSSGTLALSFATGQTANEVLASPDGSSGAVSLRALVGADIPAVNVAATGNGGITGTLPVTHGGTGATTLTGVLHGSGTSAFTASNVSLASEVTGTLPVANGGTGATTLTGVLHGSGTSAFTASNVSLTSEVTGTLPVANGGTGVATLTGLALGNGTSAMSAYAGTSCTNQFPRSLSASGAATCASVSLTADVTGILGAANGGTGNGFTAFTGPTTSTKTFTLPNASATILTSNAAVTVAQGGTGATTLTGPLKGNGTSAFTAAVSSDIYGLWTGTCSSSTYLRGDGSCQTPSGGSPGGSTTQFQYNNAGAFDGTANVTYNSGDGRLQLAGTVGARIESTAPILQFSESDVTSTQQNWRAQINSSEFDFQTCDSAFSTCTTLLSANRSGTTVTAIDLTATTVRVNGSAVCRADGTGCPSTSTKTAAATITTAASSCTVNRNIAGIPSCTWSSTGNVTVNFTGSYFSSGPVCVNSGVNGGPFVARNDGTPSTSSTNVTLANSSGSAVEGSFTIICSGPG